MRRIVFALGLLMAVALAACAENPSATGSERSMPPTPSEGPSTGSEGSMTPTPSEGPSRVDAYETLIRHLANPAGPAPIYVLTDLCFHLIEPEFTCPDRLSLEEEQELRARLQDVGEIVFIPTDVPGPSSDDSFQEILLSPIVETADGLRVEGGALCGGLCGSGAVYRLVVTDDGYVVKGTDDTYGSWVS